ncbi:hypothetical protein BC829DRAFT_396348 [Chytridium lagenaria]|nr:hypothetical protein BC829DRAFT_396348 [Chytridium lagenaria]
MLEQQRADADIFLFLFFYQKSYGSIITFHSSSLFYLICPPIFFYLPFLILDLSFRSL